MANSKRKCTGCKERFYPVDMIKLPVGYFHDMPCAIGYSTRQKDKAKAKQATAAAKEKRKQHRADKERIKRPAELAAEAQDAINRYVRLRDYRDGCISCDKTKEQVEAEHGWKVGGCWDCGHYRSRGAAKHLRFNLKNMHKQCKSCNGGGGKYSHKAATVDQMYRVKLIAKIGLEAVEALENNNEVRKFSNDYYRRIKKIFNKRARILEKRLGLK